MSTKGGVRGKIMLRLSMALAISMCVFCNAACTVDELTYFDTCTAVPLGANDQPEAGRVYYWEEDPASGLQGLTDTIYLAGNLPILITVPHGGRTYDSKLEAGDPLYLPDRTCGTLTDDAYTLKLAYDLMVAIYDIWGGYPHMILNRLPRIKIDQNRTASEECNPYNYPRGLKAWDDFHVHFKQKATDTILAEYGKGLYIDLHGKPDFYGAAVHVGYHLSAYDLAYYSDASLNNSSKRFIGDSSLRFLYQNLNPDPGSGAGVPFTRLLREDRSFGTILDGYIKTIADPFFVFRASPRTDLKKPYPYYSGDINTLLFCGATQTSDGIDCNTAEYGNAYTATAFINGFQLETGYRLRQYHSQEYAQKVALAIKDYLQINYGF